MPIAGDLQHLIRVEPGGFRLLGFEVDKQVDGQVPFLTFRPWDAGQSGHQLGVGPRAVGVEADHPVRGAGVSVVPVNDDRLGQQEVVGGDPVFGDERLERGHVWGDVRVVRLELAVVERPPLNEVVDAASFIITPPSVLAVPVGEPAGDALFALAAWAFLAADPPVVVAAVVGAPAGALAAGGYDGGQLGEGCISGHSGRVVLECFFVDGAGDGGDRDESQVVDEVPAAVFGFFHPLEDRGGGREGGHAATSVWSSAWARQ